MKKKKPFDFIVISKLTMSELIFDWAFFLEKKKNENGNGKHQWENE